ncbi:hypothetical protein AB0C97_21335 [Streptomyces goshikiensis]|uniref:hypothetical protein n=1 Tax=Streptomyces goshikiensis TaxID=1942 RepID=UPI00340A6DF1
MADERNRWLDQAAAEELLRGAPVGPVADQRARAEADRLRAALDTLAPTLPHPAAGPELPGEAAALAAFRAAHGTVRPEEPGSAAAHEPLVELGREDHRAAELLVRTRPPRRNTAVRFGLAAALASVAVGGLAAAVGTGLLDQGSHTSAGPLPSVSVSTGGNPAPTGDGGGLRPLRSPQARPTEPFGGDGFAPVGPSHSPGEETGADAAPDPDGHAAVGGSAGISSPPAFGGGGAVKDGGQDRPTSGTKERERDRDRDRENTVKAADLCEAYRAGQMNDDRRERLSKLARGTARIARYCEALLDVARDGDIAGGTGTSTGSGRSTTDGPGPGSDALLPPTPTATRGSLGFRSRL